MVQRRLLVLALPLLSVAAKADVGDALEGGEIENGVEQGAFHGGVVGHAGLEVFQRRWVFGDDFEADAKRSISSNNASGRSSHSPNVALSFCAAMAF